MRIARFRRFIVTLAATIMVFTGALALAPPAQAVHLTRDVFFFVPHQDDEVLQYGAAIAEHVAAGRTVWVVLLTDGGSSAYCLSEYPTRAACVAARDQEFINGVTAMGGHPVIRADRMIDGTLTQAYAKAVILNYYPNYPNSSFKAPSEFDISPDHNRIGRALRSTGIIDARYYIKHSEWPTHAGSLTAQYNQDAVLDMYPFGKISVPRDFANAYSSVGNRSKAYA